MELERDLANISNPDFKEDLKKSLFRRILIPDKYIDKERNIIDSSKVGFDKYGELKVLDGSDDLQEDFERTIVVEDPNSMKGIYGNFSFSKEGNNQCIAVDIPHILWLQHTIDAYKWSASTFKDNDPIRENFLSASWALLVFNKGINEETYDSFCDYHHFVATTIDESSRTIVAIRYDKPISSIEEYENDLELTKLAFGADGYIGPTEFIPYSRIVGFFESHKPYILSVKKIDLFSTKKNTEISSTDNTILSPVVDDISLVPQLDPTTITVAESYEFYKRIGFPATNTNGHEKSPFKRKADKNKNIQGWSQLSKEEFSKICTGKFYKETDIFPADSNVILRLDDHIAIDIDMPKGADEQPLMTDENIDLMSRFTKHLIEKLKIDNGDGALITVTGSKGIHIVLKKPDEHELDKMGLGFIIKDDKQWTISTCTKATYEFEGKNINMDMKHGRTCLNGVGSIHPVTKIPYSFHPDSVTDDEPDKASLEAMLFFLDPELIDNKISIEEFRLKRCRNKITENAGNNDTRDQDWKNYNNMLEILTTWKDEKDKSKGLKYLPWNANWIQGKFVLGEERTDWPRTDWLRFLDAIARAVERLPKDQAETLANALLEVCQHGSTFNHEDFERSFVKSRENCIKTFFDTARRCGWSPHDSQKSQMAEELQESRAQKKAENQELIEKALNPELDIHEAVNSMGDIELAVDVWETRCIQEYEGKTTNIIPYQNSMHYYGYDKNDQFYSFEIFKDATIQLGDSIEVDAFDIQKGTWLTSRLIKATRYLDNGLTLKKKAIIDPNACAKLSDFVIATNPLGHFLGSGKQKDHLISYYLTFDIKRFKQIHKFGWQEEGVFVLHHKAIIPQKHPDDGLETILNETVIEKQDDLFNMSINKFDGMLVDQDNPLNKKIHTVKRDPTLFTRYNQLELISKLDDLWGPNALMPFGFFAGSLVYTDVKRKLGQFPLMSLSGPLALGKSSLVRLLYRAFLGFKWEGVNLKSNTKVASRNQMFQFKDIPLVLSEANADPSQKNKQFKNDILHEFTDNIALNHYDDFVSHGRGVPYSNYNREEIIECSLMLVCNHLPDGFGPAHLSRTVDVPFRKGDRDFSKTENLFNEIKEFTQSNEAHKYDGIGEYLLQSRKLLIEKIIHHEAIYQDRLKRDLRNKLGSDNSDIPRLSKTYALPLAGLEAVLDLLGAEMDAKDFVLSSCYESMFSWAVSRHDEMEELSEDTKSFLRHILYDYNEPRLYKEGNKEGNKEDMRNGGLAGVEGLAQYKHDDAKRKIFARISKDGKTLYLCINKAYAEFETSKRHKHGQSIKAIKKELEQSSYLLQKQCEKGRKTMSKSIKVKAECGDWKSKTFRFMPLDIKILDQVAGNDVWK